MIFCLVAVVENLWSEQRIKGHCWLFCWRKKNNHQSFYVTSKTLFWERGHDAFKRFWQSIFLSLTFTFHSFHKLTLNTPLLMLIKFLSQSGPRAQKHSSSWAHPLSVFIVHYVLITVSIIAVHDYVYGDKMMANNGSMSIQEEQKRHKIAKYTFVYFSILLLYRFLQNGGNKVIQKSILYENTWLCNSTLFMGALGLWTRRDILVLGHVVAVSIDQVLWYVDLAGWALRWADIIAIKAYL